jgi:DNA-binding MarR family transcriptional regulator
MADTATDTSALAELLVRASWRLRKNERKTLEPFALTFAQARALRVLVKDGPMRMGDLAGRLEIVPRSATTRIDDLEGAGLVARRSAPGDRRSILVEATEHGHELVCRLAEERRASADSLFSSLAPEERADLARLLAAVVDRGVAKVGGDGAAETEVTP